LIVVVIDVFPTALGRQPKQRNATIQDADAFALFPFQILLCGADAIAWPGAKSLFTIFQ